MSVRNIVVNFLKCFDELKSENILSDKSLKEYWSYNIHSYLQYCLIMAANHEGFKGIPEYKLRLSKPIDKHGVDQRFRSRRIRYMRTITVDVGFLKENKLVGIGEIYTPDEIHGSLPSEELEKEWITPYNKLTHIAEYEGDIEFIILIIGLWTLPSWKDAKRKTLQEWFKCWERLVELISNKKQAEAIFIEALNRIKTKQ